MTIAMNRQLGEGCVCPEMRSARPTEVNASALTPRCHSTASDLFPELLPASRAVRPPKKYSAATEDQHCRIVEMLRTGCKTTLDFRRAGVMQSQTRIFELRAQGYDIQTVARVTIYDDEGYPHRGVAMYELLAEPQDGNHHKQGGFIAPHLLGLLAVSAPAVSALAAIVWGWCA